MKPEYLGSNDSVNFTRIFFFMPVLCKSLRYFDIIYWVIWTQIPGILELELLKKSAQMFKNNKNKHNIGLGLVLLLRLWIVWWIASDVEFDEDFKSEVL